MTREQDRDAARLDGYVIGERGGDISEVIEKYKDDKLHLRPWAVGGWEHGNADKGVVKAMIANGTIVEDSK